MWLCGPRRERYTILPGLNSPVLSRQSCPAERVKLGGAFSQNEDGLMSEHTVASIPDEKLLERAVRGCRSRVQDRRCKHSRWVHVADTFALGSTFARQLCERFGVDPDESVK